MRASRWIIGSLAATLVAGVAVAKQPSNQFGPPEGPPQNSNRSDQAADRADPKANPDREQNTNDRDADRREPNATPAPTDRNRGNQDATPNVGGNPNISTPPTTPGATDRGDASRGEAQRGTDIRNPAAGTPQNFGAPQNFNTDNGNRMRQGDQRNGDSERFRFHEGGWWYWLPESRWVYYDGRSWQDPIAPHTTFYRGNNADGPPPPPMDGAGAPPMNSGYSTGTGYGGGTGCPVMNCCGETYTTSCCSSGGRHRHHHHRRR